MAQDMFVCTHEKEGAEMISKWIPTQKYKEGKQITIHRLEQWADCNHIMLEDLDKQETNPNKKKADYIAHFPDSTKIVIEVKEITKAILMKGSAFIFKGCTNSRGAFAAADTVRDKIKDARPSVEGFCRQGHSNTVTHRPLGAIPTMG